MVGDEVPAVEAGTPDGVLVAAVVVAAGDAGGGLVGGPTVPIRPPPLRISVQRKERGCYCLIFSCLINGAFIPAGPAVSGAEVVVVGPFG